MAAEEQIASNNGAIMTALQLILAGGIGGAIVGGILSFVEKLILDRKLARQQADYDKQLEALKSQLGRKNVVHKLQFEMEFTLYRDFWKALMDVRTSASITPMLDIIPEGKEPLEVYEERWKNAADKFNKAQDLLYHNLPFYHDDVSKPAKELLTECGRHLKMLPIKLRQEKAKLDIYDEDEKLTEMIKKAVYDIEIVIKKRIGLLQEAELIE